MSWFSGKWNFRLIRNENLPEGKYEGQVKDGKPHGQALIIRKPGMSIRGNGLTINQSVGGYLGQIVQGSG